MCVCDEYICARRSITHAVDRLCGGTKRYGEAERGEYAKLGRGGRREKSETK